MSNMIMRYIELKSFKLHLYRMFLLIDIRELKYVILVCIFKAVSILNFKALCSLVRCGEPTDDGWSVPTDDGWSVIKNTTQVLLTSISLSIH